MAKKQTPQSQPINVSSTVTAAPTSSIHAFWSKYFLHQILIFFLGAGIYVNTIGHHYAVDDIMTITSNKFTKRGFQGIPGLLKYDTFFGFFDDNKSIVSGGRYRPVTPIMFAIECQLFADWVRDAKGEVVKKKDKHDGLDYPELKVTPKDYSDNIVVHISHFINIILYGLLCVILYRFLLLLLNPQKQEDNFKANFIVLVTTLLFTLHPLHVEAVANIKGRDEIVSLMGSLIAAYLVLKAWYKPEKKTLFTALALVAFFVAFFAKESTITYLAVMVISFWFFTTATIKDIAIRIAPFIVLTVVCMGIRNKCIYDTYNPLHFPKFETDELMNDPFLMVNPNTKYVPLVAGSNTKKIVNATTDTYIPMPAGEKLNTIFYAWGTYLKLLFVPHPLTNDYYPRQIPHVTDDSGYRPFAMLSILAYIGLGVFGVWCMIKRKIIGWGILYYLATFSIISNLFFPIGTNMSDRFMFMPSIGWAFCMAVLLWALVKNNKVILPVAILSVVLGLFAVKTFTRNAAWYNDFTLFQTDVQVSDKSAKQLNAAGGSLIDEAGYNRDSALVKASKLPIAERVKAEAQAKAKYFVEVKNALGYLEKALEIHPGYSGAWLLYANAHYYLATENETPKNQQEVQNALREYQIALAAYDQVAVFRPDHEDIKQNRGVVMRDMGKFYGEKMGDLNNAVKYLEESLKLNVDDAETFRLLGTAYGVAGQPQKAIEYFEQSLKYLPDAPATQENLAIAYMNVNNFTKAEELLQTAIKVYRTMPENAPDRNKTIGRALLLLQTVYSKAGRQADAAALSQEIATLTPQQPQQQQLNLPTGN